MHPDLACGCRLLLDGFNNDGNDNEARHQNEDTRSDVLEEQHGEGGNEGQIEHHREDVSQDAAYQAQGKVFQGFSRQTK